ncbi:adenylate/guanylate cyclase family protein (plasmid) [Mycobacterium sp. JS623]|uniref:adenylate/guanylate cyclase domain-containing protein n=1 Tax=Mycobacterium sp. JS623 TaxID=212767 RepID=UPI0002A5B1C7|nr:adenylate/guanylate cyclase domain-containing protein [Mycobacterium sp. JS623]AGB26858.1 adenylate/guanylate cyclase family protein [Mycobacterium sp. JS623]
MTPSRLCCGSCGKELPLTAKFCSECGARLTHSTSSAEYKQVTVLFADVVRSMDIAAAVGAERLREIMADLADHCAAAVQRYGGTVNQFTGDGIMAVFGAPTALEDHAFRACMAALAVQAAARRLAHELEDRDGVDLRLRVGLNSGQVIAGEISSGYFGYTAIGEQVGMAQRMESVAPPGGVMLSTSTARLVEGSATLSEPESVRMKGAKTPVTAYRLLGVERHATVRRTESDLVGRQREMSTVQALLESGIGGHGRVVGVVGPPGIGKSRLTREISRIASARGAEVVTAFCESHASQVPFHVVARLMRAITGIAGLDAQTARDRLRGKVGQAEPEDLLLFHDLLGIGDPEALLPRIDPDARRRRLTGVVNAVSLTRETPTVYVVEDAHWIDEASESMLADLFTVIPQTSSLVLVTYRPEYGGALTRGRGTQTITLEPLSDPEAATLVSQLLGSDPSVSRLGQTVAERAAGNPFFAEEIVRDLAERAVLHGNRGAYICTVNAAEVTVPATVQATIAARVDRLDPKAKHTLNAAAVIGAKFSRDLLETLRIDPALDDLVVGELIDQIRFAPHAEYVFHHPLIRVVAYESQLKSDRAEMHRRLAAAIEARHPSSADENAALIAEHLEAAGDLHAAYGWHMRAATWATNRDIAGARLSWERARTIADALPAGDPGRTTMRIATRTMLCGTGWRIHADVSDRFDELRELCSAAGDKPSLGIASAGLVVGYAHQNRMREASRLASETWALAEAVADATLTVGLSFPVIYGKIESAEWNDVLGWSQTVIDLADGDPSTGNFLVGCPLALAVTSRGMARYFLGQPGWPEDLRHGMSMAQSADPASYAGVVGYVYLLGVPFGVLRPSDVALREIEDALQIAERSSDDVVVRFTQATLGLALMHRQDAADRERGQKLAAEVSEAFLTEGHNLCDLPGIQVFLAREKARGGDRDDALRLIRDAVDLLFRDGQLLLWAIPATGVLVDTLLDRGADGDVAEAKAAIERLASAPAGEGLAMRDIWLLRMRVLCSLASGDKVGYQSYRDRYRAMARTLRFEGHLQWAQAMP